MLGLIGLAFCLFGVGLLATARSSRCADRAVRGRVALIVCVLTTACSSHTPGPGLDVDRALAFMNELASAPRPVDHTEVARTQIEDALTRAQIPFQRETVGTVQLPSIDVLAFHRPSHPVTIADPNYVMRFGPPGPALLVMAHYDTVVDSLGAADNAAAVGVAIELARSLVREPPSYPVMIVITAGEEIGLVGAEALATRHASEISFAIALDLVGGDGDLVVNGASTLIGTAELQWLADAADRAGMTLHVPPVHRVISRWWPQAERSDHGPFTRRGVPAVHLYNRGTEGEWIDLAYHSSRDVPARIHRESLDELGRLLRALVEVPPASHDGDGYWVPLLGGVVVPRVALIGLEIVLVLVVLVTLVLSRDGLFSWVTDARERAMGAAVVVGAVCYLAAIVIGIAIERIVAGEHPAAWLHGPLRSLVAQALVIGGALGLLTSAVARISAWRGEFRYLAVSMIALASVGSAFLALGAAEVAWVWLLPAALLALAPRLGQLAAWIPVATTLLPAVLVLHPSQLREAAWNGFLPSALPLSAVLGLLGIPVVSGVAYLLRRRRAVGPLGTLALGVGCGLLLLTGLLVALSTAPTCTAAEFKAFHLACERA